MFDNPRAYNADIVLAEYEDHREAIDLGDWTELAIGDIHLVRDADGTVRVESLEALVI